VRSIEVVFRLVDKVTIGEIAWIFLRTGRPSIVSLRRPWLNRRGCTRMNLFWNFDKVVDKDTIAVSVFCPGVFFSLLFLLSAELLMHKSRSSQRLHRQGLSKFVVTCSLFKSIALLGVPSASLSEKQTSCD